jgi:hypothetical protein
MNVCVQIKLEKAYSSNQALHSIVRTRSYHLCHRVHAARAWARVYMYMDRVATPGTGQAERVRRREAPASDTAPLPPLPPHSLSAATIAATHAAASISTAPLLHLPLSDAVGISHPHRCRPSLLPTPRRSPPPASTACIGHCQRRHLRRHHCQRERRLGRGRGRGLGYTAIR